MKKLPSQEYLQSRIDYDPETGEARWKRVDENFGNKWKAFNTRYAGKPIPLRANINQKEYALSHLVYKLSLNTDVTRMSYLNKDSSDLRLANLVSVSDVSRKIRNNNKAPKQVKTHTLIEDDVSDYITYNHHTGIFMWKPRNSRAWNNRYADTEAGSMTDRGYIRITINYKNYQAHRLAWFMYYGVDPEGYLIDHIDNNRANNCISNLRLANHSFNAQYTSINSSGYDTTNSGRFISILYINNARISLGTFDTEEEACAAYEKALKKYKPTYQFSKEEQEQLDLLHAMYPNVSAELQHACHCLQVKALNYYVQASEKELLE